VDSVAVAGSLIRRSGCGSPTLSPRKRKEEEPGGSDFWAKIYLTHHAGRLATFPICPSFPKGFVFCALFFRRI
jgi:hypothetical protein